MPNMIELEITTVPEDERDRTPLARVELETYFATAAIRDGRFVLELRALETDEQRWCIDCGAVKPRLSV